MEEEQVNKVTVFAVFRRPETRDIPRIFFLVILCFSDARSDPNVIPAIMTGIMIGAVGMRINPRYAMNKTNLYKPNYSQ